MQEAEPTPNADAIRYSASRSLFLVQYYDKSQDHLNPHDLRRLLEKQNIVPERIGPFIMAAMGEPGTWYNVPLAPVDEQRISNELTDVFVFLKTATSAHHSLILDSSGTLLTLSFVVHRCPETYRKTGPADDHTRPASREPQEQRGRCSGMPAPLPRLSSMIIPSISS